MFSALPPPKTLFHTFSSTRMTDQVHDGLQGFLDTELRPLVSVETRIYHLLNTVAEHAPRDKHLSFKLNSA